MDWQLKSGPFFHVFPLNRVPPHPHIKNYLFFKFWLAISDSICWSASGVCMASEDLEASWPDLHRWPYSCNLWHQWLSKFFKHQRIVNFHSKFLTLKVPSSHLVATRGTSVGSVEGPLTGLQRRVGDIFVNLWNHHLDWTWTSPPSLYSFLQLF